MRTAILILLALAVPAFSLDDPPTQKPDDPPTPKPVDPEINMDPAQRIKHNGYPVETQQVTTQDGYVLPLYRIPKGKNDASKAPKRPAVLLLHGFETSSADWLVNQAHLSAPYIFADGGFDVFLGNFRGSKYARKHQQWDSTTHLFWQFSLDELITQDLPAMITKVLEVSKADVVYVVAHSTGATATIAFLSRPQNQALAKKVRHLHALAPLLTMEHVQGPLKLAGPLIKNMQTASALFGVDELKPNKELQQSWAKYVCHDPETDLTCKNVLLMLAGPNTHQIDKTRIDLINAHSPSGTSVQTLVHLGQIMSLGRLTAFDLGSKLQNKLRYGQELPPQHDVYNVKSMVSLYSSECDWIAQPLDVNYQAAIFKAVLMNNVIVPSFNHMDFLWGTRAAAEIYKPVMTAIAEDFPVARPTP